MTARPFVVAAVVLAGLLTTACLPGMPRRVPGSDITLPESPDQRLLGALTSMCVNSDTAVAVHPGRSRCAPTSGTDRTSPDPAPPPGQKTP